MPGVILAMVLAEGAGVARWVDCFCEKAMVFKVSLFEMK